MGQTKYFILLFLVCLVWGATPAFGKFTVESFSPLMITGTRFLCISAILFGWMLITKDFKGFRLSREILIILVAMGFMGILVHNGLLFLGLQHTTATNTALIESIGPTATTVLAFIFLGERLNRYGWLGILVSSIGAVTIVSKGSLEVLLNLSFNIGDILIVCCEVAWSAYAVISWRIQGRLDTVAVTAWSGLFGALMCYVVGLATNSLHIYEVNTSALIGFGYLVIFSGVFAFVSWNYGVQFVGASKAGVFIYLVPLTGGIVGVLVLGESIQLSQLIGAFLILGGVLVTVRSKVQMHEEKKAQGGDEKNLLKKFPELAEAHDKKLSKIIAAERTKSMIQDMANEAKNAVAQAEAEKVLEQAVSENKPLEEVIEERRILANESNEENTLAKSEVTLEPLAKQNEEAEDIDKPQEAVEQEQAIETKAQENTNNDNENNEVVKEQNSNDLEPSVDDVVAMAQVTGAQAALAWHTVTAAISDIENNLEYICNVEEGLSAEDRNLQAQRLRNIIAKLEVKEASSEEVKPNNSVVDALIEIDNQHKAQEQLEAATQEESKACVENTEDAKDVNTKEPQDNTQEVKAEDGAEPLSDGDKTQEDKAKLEENKPYI